MRVEDDGYHVYALGEVLRPGLVDMQVEAFRHGREFLPDKEGEVRTSPIWNLRGGKRPFGKEIFAYFDIWVQGFSSAGSRLSKSGRVARRRLGKLRVCWPWGEEEMARSLRDKPVPEIGFSVHGLDERGNLVVWAHSRDGFAGVEEAGCAQWTRGTRAHS